MAYEPKDLRGALFKNRDKKEDDAPTVPDYRGDLVIEGVKYRLSGWVKESSRGKFLSLSARRDDGQGSTAKRDPADAQEPF
jgi:hypothetical protein